MRDQNNACYITQLASTFIHIMVKSISFALCHYHRWYFPVLFTFIFGRISHTSICFKFSYKQCNCQKPSHGPGGGAQRQTKSAVNQSKKWEPESELKHNKLNCATIKSFTACLKIFSFFFMHLHFALMWSASHSKYFVPYLDQKIIATYKERARMHAHERERERERERGRVDSCNTRVLRANNSI